MSDDILNYDPQLEIKVINLLFHLEMHSPRIVYKKMSKILDLKNRWNIWLLGRNLYHVCYGRPRLVIPMCELASFARDDIFKFESNDNIDYKSEWNAALTVSLISNQDNILSCAPQESVFFYGLLCNYNIIDPTLQFVAVEQIFETFKSTDACQQCIIIETIFPLLLSCFNILKTNFSNFLNEILSFIDINKGDQSSKFDSFNYELIYEEIQNFMTMKCDMKQITPLILGHETNKSQENSHSYASASDRKKSLLYQRKKANQPQDDNDTTEFDEDSEYDDFDSIDINEEEENADSNDQEKENDNDNQNQDKNENENQNNNNDNNENNNNNNKQNEDHESIENDNNKNEHNESGESSDDFGLFKFKSLSFSHGIHKIISLDDVDSLQKFSTTANFSFDLRIETSLTCCYGLLMNHPTLIQLSAFYGSLKCFKFLYLNKASLDLKDFDDEMPNSIASFAIAGGNIEIVRILISSKVDFSSALFIAASYHRNELFFWFIENMGSDGFDVNEKQLDGMNLMHYAAESNNLSIAQFLIESEIKIDFASNLDDDYIETPFNLACNFDCIGIVKIICDSYSDKIPREAILEGISVCISANSASTFAFLIEFTKTKKIDGKLIFKISLDEIRELKEKQSADKCSVLSSEYQISSILNEYEKMLELELH